MTTSGILAWVQIILLLIIGGGLLWYIRLLKQGMDAQKVRIEALSGVLQDFEHINNAMKRMMDAMNLVIDTVSDPAALQREQAYKVRVDRDVEDFKENYCQAGR